MRVFVHRPDATDADDLEASIEGNLHEEYEAKRLSDEAYKAALRDHEHHLVRETTSQVTIEPEEDTPGVEVTSTVTVVDMYCFTCEEWVGVSGVDLSGTPRSKNDAYYLGGPPEDLCKTREMTQEDLQDLAYRAVQDVDRFETVENAPTSSSPTNWSKSERCARSKLILTG